MENNVAAMIFCCYKYIGMKVLCHAASLKFDLH